MNATAEKILEEAKALPKEERLFVISGLKRSITEEEEIFEDKKDKTKRPRSMASYVPKEPKKLEISKEQSERSKKALKSIAGITKDSPTFEFDRGDGTIVKW